MTFIRSLKAPFLHIIAFAAFLSGAVWLRARAIRKQGPLVRILLVHHIKNAHRFELMIREIARYAHPISYMDLREGKFDASKVNILFTMDDGYESWYVKGLPILERYGVPVVFFVPSGFVKCAGNEDAVHTYCENNLKLGWDSPPLTRDMLKACAAHPLVTIGGHTCNHRFLPQLSPEDIEREVREDKAWLETELGAPVRVFAYPFGNHDAVVASVVSGVGYETAMTTESDFVTVRDSEFLLPRSNHGTVHPFLLRLWILGAYDFAEQARAWVLGIVRGK